MQPMSSGGCRGEPWWYVNPCACLEKHRLARVVDWFDDTREAICTARGARCHRGEGLEGHAEEGARAERGPGAGSADHAGEPMCCCGPGQTLVLEAGKRTFRSNAVRAEHLKSRV